MATISTGNLTAIADNISKSLLDLEAALITNVIANSPTKTTITNGAQAGSNSLLSRTAALNDTAQELALAGVAIQDAAKVAAAVNFTASGFYLNYAEYLIALDKHVAGLSAFLVTNVLLVGGEFAAAFNYVAANAVNLGLAGTAPTAILPANVFVNSDQILGSVAVTAAAAGTFSPGTALDLTKYGPAAMYLKNTAGAPTTGTATSFTVTYTNAAGTPAQTSTQALGGALGAGAYLAINSISGSAVSAITVNSGGVNGDAIAVVIKPARVITY
jgi:hypothetical protein